MNTTTILQDSYPSIHELSSCSAKTNMFYPIQKQYDIAERFKNKNTSVLWRDNEKQVHQHFNQQSTSYPNVKEISG